MGLSGRSPNCQEFQLSGVLEFRTGVLEIQNQRWEMGHLKGEMGQWDIEYQLLNLGN